MKQIEIRHHLSDALLMAYSAGSLPEAFSLTVAAHVSMCDECRARMGAFDTVGGALIEGCAAAELSSDSLQATLALIAAEDAKPVASGLRTGSHTGAHTGPHTEAHTGAHTGPRTPPRKGILPAPVQAYVGGDLDAVRWRRVGMGMKQAILPTGGKAMARLLYIPAGVAVPDHGHNGTELTLVLQGAFEDEVDHFGHGDIEVSDETLDHTPVADIGADCICLAATDAPLRFHGLLARLAQPFLRI